MIKNEESGAGLSAAEASGFSAGHLFASPFRNGNNDALATAIAGAVQQINHLKPSQANSSAFLGNNAGLVFTRGSFHHAKLQERGKPLDEVIGEVTAMFEGLPNWGHPLNMSNICPQENTAAIIASMLTQVFSPNILEAEYAWNTARAELESAAILADLAGWDARKAGGLYTYGGSGCWMYQLKYALSRVLPDSRNKGIRTDGKIICSEQAHYAMFNSTDWTGLGMDHIITVKTLPGSNTLDPDHLEEILKRCTARNIPVISVICTMATTDACAFDPVKKVRDLLDRYPNSPEYGKALLYCDAVIGWAWMAFKDYDFTNNPMGLSESALEAAGRNLKAVEEIRYADAFGVDFHKSFAPLASSMFVYRDAAEFEQLLKRKEAAYLQERGDYNPHSYTLEVSRSASGSMAGWATLTYLGSEGIRAVLARGLENKRYLLHKMAAYPDMVCANRADNGSVVLLRIYSRDTHAFSQYENELCDSACQDALSRHNKLTESIGELLWQWFREGKKINGMFTPYLSLTKGFRPAAYTDCDDSDAVVYALKVYPVNVFITEEIMDHALVCIRAARDEVMPYFNSN